MLWALQGYVILQHHTLCFLLKVHLSVSELTHSSSCISWTSFCNTSSRTLLTNMETVWAATNCFPCSLAFHSSSQKKKKKKEKQSQMCLFEQPYGAYARLCSNKLIQIWMQRGISRRAASTCFWCWSSGPCGGVSGRGVWRRQVVVWASLHPNLQTDTVSSAHRVKVGVFCSVSWYRCQRCPAWRWMRLWGRVPGSQKPPRILAGEKWVEVNCSHFYV